MSVVRAELKARDIMTPDPVCVSASAGIRELARAFDEHSISGVPVVDQSGRVIGVVSKTDLIKRCSEGVADIPPAYLFEILIEQGSEDSVSEVIPEPLICVQDFMTEDPLTARADASVRGVARQMHEHRFHRVIVTDEKQFPLGIITSLDVIDAFLRS